MYQSEAPGSRYNSATLKPSEPTAALAASILVAALAAGCGADPRPADRIETVRALYRAEVTGFVVEGSPEPVAAAPASAPETAPSPEADDGGSGLVAPPVPASDVVLDLRLRHEPGEEIAGLTVEVGLLDPAGTEKEHYRIWIEAAGAATGEKLVTYRLEDVPYVEGDRFVAEVRTPVPASERALYKEFPVAR